MIKVLLVDDDYPALEGLRQILRWETFCRYQDAAYGRDRAGRLAP